MNMDSDNDGGSDVFWPGYVDAVTNLVLNLLFVVVIMTVAVFIFAMELGRRHLAAAVPQVEAPKQEQPAGVKTEQPSDQTDAALKQQLEALQQQVTALKDKEREAQQLKDKLAAMEKEAPGKLGKSKVVKATIRSENPASTLEKVTAGLVVDFVDDAITLSDEEAQQLRGQLGRIIASGGAKLEVNVPPGFTEARRLGFYRAMAVRNLLIDMQMPADRIEVSVREGKPTSDSSLVMVNPVQPKE